MKAIKYMAIAFLLSGVVMIGQVKAQEVGIAADKQKQENLEKIKKRQEELRKKYNSLTPEQAADAKRRANEYRKSGGKTIPAATKTQPSSGSKNAVPSPAVKKAPQPSKQGNVQKPAGSQKPVWMDTNGKVKQASSTQSGKPETKPSGTRTKKTEVSTKPATVTKPPAKPGAAAEKKTGGVKPK